MGNCAFWGGVEWVGQELHISFQLCSWLYDYIARRSLRDTSVFWFTNFIVYKSVWPYHTIPKVTRDRAVQLKPQKLLNGPFLRDPDSIGKGWVLGICICELPLPLIHISTEDSFGHSWTTDHIWGNAVPIYLIYGCEKWRPRTSSDMSQFVSGRGGSGPHVS